MSAMAGAAAAPAWRRFAPRRQRPACPTRRGFEERPRADSRWRSSSRVYEWPHSYSGGRDSPARSAASTAAEPLAMPTHDGVRVHDDQGCAPSPPHVGEQHPKQSISVAECWTLHGAFEHRQLLTECQFSSAPARYPPQISARDRSTTTCAASISYPVPQSTTGSTGAGDLILANDRRSMT